MDIEVTTLERGWRKLRTSSDIARRELHVDLKTVGADPAFTFIFFGGSGITVEEYSRRSSTSPLFFDDALQDLGARHAFVFAFVTAPFDLPLEHQNPRLEAHVQSEILPAVASAIGPPAADRWIVGGYSGGAIPALIAARDRRCFSCRLLGPDALDGCVPSLPHLRQTLSACYNLGDGVFDANVHSIIGLRTAGTMVVHRHLPGAHDLRHYVGNGSFAGIVRTAFL